MVVFPQCPGAYMEDVVPGLQGPGGGTSNVLVPWGESRGDTLPWEHGQL